MDEATQKLVDQIIGTEIGNCVATKYIDRGVSALVFEADQSGEKVALKVFDPNFLEGRDAEEQKDRINRQVDLKELDHPNLVKIFAGGKCDKTEFHFLVMEFVNSTSLEKVVEDVPPDNIRSIIAQLANAAQFLEQHKLVHRDIKPANIAISDDFQAVKLLDLGVVRPIGISEVTDSTDKMQFVGTTRYSPPEFLVRLEEQTLDGFRSINYYQIGGVLHDLIVGRALFDGATPYQRLVYHVLLTDPVITPREGVEPGLVHLCRSCLVKDPVLRSKLVSWESLGVGERKSPSLEDARQSLASLQEQDLSSSQSTDEIADFDAQLRSFVDKLRNECSRADGRLPPHIFSDIDSEGGDKQFKLTIEFAPSVRHKIVHPVCCHLQISILSETIVAFEICGAAFVGDLKSSPDGDKALPYIEIFRGVLNENAVEATAVFIYQSVKIATESSMHATPSTEGRWLREEELTP